MARAVGRHTVMGRRIIAAKTEGDARLFKVVRIHLHFHNIAHHDTDEMFAELAGNMREHLMAVRQFDAEHRAGQDGNYLTFDFYSIWIGHIWI
jgi:hypothetical protein